MRKKSLVVFLLLLVVSVSTVWAANVYESSLYSSTNKLSLYEQLGISSSSAGLPSNASLLAISNSNYPVTCGDSYTLTLCNQNIANGTNQVSTFTLQVDADCHVTVPFVGSIDATNMTFTEFKRKVENELKNFYSYLTPQLQLSSCGVFEVFVYGEVPSSKYVQTWGLARLSDFCSYATKSASTRKVIIEYPNGVSRTYDLYNAIANGNVEDNPYIKPGCKIKFVKADTTVFVNGLVCKPGEYQIKTNDTLKDVIESYARGFDFNADTSFVSVESSANGQYSTTMVAYKDAASYQLKNMDSVKVLEINSSRPYVTVQGAASQNGKFTYEFFEGETVEQLLRAIKGQLLETSDVNNAYILRGTLKIAIDPASVASSSRGTIALEQGDVVVIPYIQQYVTVSGGVAAPGNYKYEPDRSVEYYINLAGGFTADAREGSLKVIDSLGNNTDGSVVLPNYVISVKRRNTSVASDISLGLSIATLGVSVLGTFLAK